jgi:outer membrane protein insertion porin family
MDPIRTAYIHRSLLIIVVWLGLAWAGCDTTKHIKDGEYHLRKNQLKLETDKGITRKGELKDNITRLIVQKPNTYALGIFPYKIWLYNLQYKKYDRDPENYQRQSRTVEKPVVFDSTLTKRSATNIRSYLFNQGYFYPRVTDTVIFKNKKAVAIYNVSTGLNYLINKAILDIDDSVVAAFVRNSMNESILSNGKEFSMSLLEEERSRITNLLRNLGYYKFNQENINFTIDTVNKAYFRDIDNPFESAINFIALQKKQKKPTLDVTITIRGDDVPRIYNRFVINKITVYPDFISREDSRDSTMNKKVINDVLFRYRKRYLKEQVIYKHIYFEKGKTYSQSDYEATINKLNHLGVFQTIRIVLVEDTTTRENFLNAIIILNPAKKMDFSTNFEVSNGTTYDLGSALSFNFRNKNLARGANVFNASLSGGIETVYDDKKGNNFFEHFKLLTKNFGFNTSLDFPKFLVPFINQSKLSRRNLPRTILGFGTNLVDRVDYFTLTNTTANLSYNWRETETKTWDLSPAFINIIRLPRISDSFQKRLVTNEFLRNSYRENFIEGENISFTFTNQAQRRGRSYSYAKLGLEEAGGLMSAINTIGASFNNTFDFQYAQYLKFDFDARHYVIRRRSTLAARFYGGVGFPYGKSPTLPYIKQYFVGGAYSIRGWRIRTLGPGGYIDPNQGSGIYIDRTGDIKLEMNGEYRFDLIQLFSGSIKLKGAVFADGGNIWLANKSVDYPGGEFDISKLGRDVAISVGAGARFDLAGFFIFRFDAAFPIKTPLRQPGDTWVFSKIDFGNSTWRSNNLILNFAIGYPF